MLPIAARARCGMPAMLTCSRAASCFSRHAFAPTNDAMRCLKMAACCRPLPLQRAHSGAPRRQRMTTTTRKKAKHPVPAVPAAFILLLAVLGRVRGSMDPAAVDKKAATEVGKRSFMSPESSSAPSPVGECANPSRRHTSSHPCSSYSKAPTSTAR